MNTHKPIQTIFQLRVLSGSFFWCQVSIPLCAISFWCQVIGLRFSMAADKKAGHKAHMWGQEQVFTMRQQEIHLQQQQQLPVEAAP